MRCILLLNKKLNSLSDFSFIIVIDTLCFLLLLFINLIAIIYEKYIGPIGTFDLHTKNLLITLTIYVIFVPIVQTILLNFITIMLKKFFHNINSIILVLTSGFMIGLLNYKSIFSIIIATIFNIVFCYVLLIYKNKKLSPFSIVIIIQAIFNFIAIIINNI